jgi:hypothetical protein
MDFIN